MARAAVRGVHVRTVGATGDRPAGGLRLEAVEARIDADLMGGPRVSWSPSWRHWSAAPTTGAAHRSAMLALYRSGRQADSLRSFQLLRARLGEELGIEPGAEFRRLEERIVTATTWLPTVGPRALIGSGPSRGSRCVATSCGTGSVSATRAALPRFQPTVGREVAIQVIRPELANDPGLHPPVRGRGATGRPVRAPPYRAALRLLARARRGLPRDAPDGGRNLADVLDRRALTPEQASRVVDQIGSALQLAHRSGVVAPRCHAGEHPDRRRRQRLSGQLRDRGRRRLQPTAIESDDRRMFHVARPTGRRPCRPRVRRLRIGCRDGQGLTGLAGEIGQIRGALHRRGRQGDRPRHRRRPPAALRGRSRIRRRATGGSWRHPGRRVASLTDADNPYKGLRSFDSADATDFYGRERLVERLLARLGEPGERGRFVAVVGPSGSGKSSVVKAGLLPAIRRDGLTGSWFTVEMTPAPHPFEALQEALFGVAVDPPATLLELLADHDSGIRKAVGRVLPDDGSQLLLVVDQFEELFTQVDAETADRFLDALVSAVTDEHSRLRVVATLRADFYDRPLRHRGLGELLREGTEIITPMTPQELDRAITVPVERSGITFEPALVAELVRDVVDRAGALPLLQYTLTELFDGRPGNRITLAGYHELGGVSGALVKRAEGLFAGLGEEARDVTRQVFLRLVTLGEGADDTRRRVLRTELEQLAVERRFLDGVLDAFGRHRLLSFDRDPVTRSPTVEISHEALLTEWTRLREWIDGARHDVRSQRRLADAMREWIAAERTPAYLLRGGRLEQLHGWASMMTLPLSEPEQEFLNASIAEAEREAVDEREREERATEAERRERQRARQLVGVGAIGVVIALLAVFGIVQWRSASDAKADTDNLLTVSELVSASEVAYANDDPELALLYAVQAVRETGDLGFADEDAVDAVHFALQQLSVQYDVTLETPVAIRSGPKGLAGVYALPPADLVAFADTAVDRTLTDDECAPIFDGPCPGRLSLPDDLPLRNGMDAYGATAPGPMALAGARVAIAAPALRSEPGLERQYEDFTARTGIAVDVVSNTGEGLLALASGDLELPDTMTWGGHLPEWAQSRVLDLGRFLDHDTLRSDFGDYVLNIGMSDEPSSLGNPNVEAYGIPLDADLKGLVFYPKAAFDDAGYDVPETWDELIGLSRRIVDDGRSPWCLAFESGFPFSGWPGTDLIESLVLSASGPDVYDGWSDGRIGFSDPAVATGAHMADSLIFEPGFVRVGPEAISNENFTEQMFNLLQRNPTTGEIDPDCWLFPRAISCSAPCRPAP